MTTYPYLLVDRFNEYSGTTYRTRRDAASMYEAFGLDPKQHLPAEGRAPRLIDGVECYIFTAAEARAFWGNKGSHMSLRVMAVCPECGKHTAASRLNQHARVHHNNVRKGY
jgi:hypothetical protein